MAINSVQHLYLCNNLSLNMAVNSVTVTLVFNMQLITGNQLLWLYSRVYVGNSEDRVSRDAAHSNAPYQEFFQCDV